MLSVATCGNYLMRLNVVLLLGFALRGPMFAQPEQGRDLKVEPLGLPPAARRWALVIGVNQYTDKKIQPLFGASSDAKAIAATLVETAGFEQHNIITLTTDDSPDNYPTRTNILVKLAFLRTLSERAETKDGLLLVFFAGHGIERNGKAYLVPSDANISDLTVLEQTALNVENLKDQLRISGFKQVIVLLDACRNNPEGKGRGGDTDNRLTNGFITDITQLNIDVDAFAMIFASSEGQRAFEFEYEEGKHRGYFSWVLEEGLKGGLHGETANEKGEITLGRLVEYLENRVPKLVVDHLKLEQKPYALIGGYKANGLVIARPKVSPSAIPPERPPVDSAQAQFTVYRLAYESVKDSRDLAVLRGYARQYPDSPFAELIAVSIKKLESWENPKDHQEYRYIPPGSFLMGCAARLTGERCPNDEMPQHHVEIRNGFWIGSTEVKQEAYERVVPAKKSGAGKFAIVRDGKVHQPNIPVVSVNWQEAADYCQKVGGRLPTEAEWEYAAGGGVDGRIYPWGNTADPSKANYFNAGNQRPVPVGTFPPNQSLYDMAGNVYEWVYDFYDASYYKGPKPFIDPRGPSTGTYRVKRGGSFDSPLERVRISARRYFDPSKKDDQTGFRCVIEKIPTP